MNVKRSILTFAAAALVTAMNGSIGFAQQGVVVQRHVVASPWASGATALAPCPQKPPATTYYVPPAAQANPPVVTGPRLPRPVLPSYRPVLVYRPLVPVVPMPASYVVGRGILGQPTLYVPSQPVRNFFRWLGP